MNNYNRHITISGNHFEALGASAICFVGDPGAHPDIDEVAVIAERDPMRGERPKAFVVQKKGAAFNSLCDIGLVIFCRNVKAIDRNLFCPWCQGSL